MAPSRCEPARVISRYGSSWVVPLEIVSSPVGEKTLTGLGKYVLYDFDRWNGVSGGIS